MIPAEKAKLDISSLMECYCDVASVKEFSDFCFKGLWHNLNCKLYRVNAMVMHVPTSLSL